MRIAGIHNALPDGFAALRGAAEAEGLRQLSRLQAEWESGQRFEVTGEALLGAWVNGALVGVGGITREPSAPTAPMLRLRRFYVLPQARRKGVARAMAAALIERAAEPMITVNAGGGSGPFWEELGFSPVHDRPWTHELTTVPTRHDAVRDSR